MLFCLRKSSASKYIYINLALQTLIFDDQINSHSNILKYFKYAFGYSKWIIDELFVKLIILFKSVFITCNTIIFVFTEYLEIIYFVNYNQELIIQARFCLRDLFKELHNLLFYIRWTIKIFIKDELISQHSCLNLSNESEVKDYTLPKFIPQYIDNTFKIENLIYTLITGIT